MMSLIEIGMGNTKRALLCLSMFVCVTYAGKSLAAQSAFKIPEEVSDFKNYLIPEHCIALMKRLNKQRAPEEDSTFVMRDIMAEVRRDTTPLGVRKDLAACGAQFRDMKVPDDSVYKETMDAQIADALLLAWAARDTSWFFSIINNDISRYPLDSVGDHQVVMGRVADAMFSFLPVNNDDFRLWDSLYNAMVVSQHVNHNGDLKVLASLIQSLSRQASILSQYDRARHHKILRIILSKVDSMRVSGLDYDKDKDHPLSGAVQSMKYIKRSALMKLNGDSLLDTLRDKGPMQYIGALVRIEHAAGFRDAVLPSAKGVGREMRALPGTVVYRDGALLLSEDVTHDEIQNEVAYSYDPSQPYVVVYMESLCHTKAAMPPGSAHRLLNLPLGESPSGCLRTMEAIKWISKSHPDIKIVLWTPFRGQVGTLLTETPAKEARELVKALDDFYGISADIVMYNTESYNMPDSYDRRRIDLSVDFLGWLMTMVGGMYERAPKVLIVAPGGKVMSSRYSIKLVNAMMEWYQSPSNVAGLGSND